MLGKLGELRVDFRVVGIRATYGTADVVRYNCRSGPTHVPDRPFIRPNPLLFFLTFRGFHIGQGATAQHGHEYFRRMELSAVAVNIAQLPSGIVDKHLIAGFVLQMHPDFTRLPPALEVVAELGVLQTLRMLLFVLFPQTLQRHPRALQFHNKIGEVLGQLSILGRLFELWLFNHSQQIAVRHVIDLLEVQSTVQESLPIFPDHRSRDIQCPGYLSIAQGGA